MRPVSAKRRREQVAIRVTAGKCGDGHDIARTPAKWIPYLYGVAKGHLEQSAPNYSPSWNPALCCPHPCQNLYEHDIPDGYPFDLGDD